MRLIGLCVVIVLAVAAACGAAAAVPGADETGFVPLFNGQDLSGWEVIGPQVWAARDGLLVCTGQDMGYLRSDAQYEDFVLRLEYQISPGGNSGIFIRGLPPSWVNSGMEIQILDDAGQQPTKHSANAIYSMITPCRNVSRPAGEWNQVEITALGRRVKVVTNGVKVVDVNLDEHPDLRDRSRRGYLFLQNHGKPVAFRNLRIRPLSEELFNGTDLAGWHVMGDPSWSVQDGVLLCSGEGGGWLRSDKEYRDLILRLEFKISAGGNSGVFFRATKDGDPAFSGMEMQILDDPNLEMIHNVGSIYGAVGPCVLAAKPAGEWNAVEISCIGEALKVRLNGIKIIDVHLDDPALNALGMQGEPLNERAPSGYLGVQNHGSPVEFRNIRVTVPPA